MVLAHTLRAEGHDASEDGTGRGTPIVADTLVSGGRELPPHGTGDGKNIVAFDTTQITSKANRSSPKPGDPCHPLAAGAHPPALAQTITADMYRSGGATAGNNPGVRNVFALGSHAGAADGDQTNRSHASGGPVGSNISEDMAYSLRSDRTQGVVATIPRRLSPTECSRLQGFPDEWNAWGVDASGERVPMSDSARYRQLGNAITVNVAHWIGSHLLSAGAP